MSEIEYLKNCINQFNDWFIKINEWSIKIEKTIIDLAVGVDLQDQNIIKLLNDVNYSIYEDLSRLSKWIDYHEYQNKFEKKQTLIKLENKIEENVSKELKAISVPLNLFFHQEKYRELETIISKRKNIKPILVKHVDDYLVEKHLLKRNKIRFKGNKEELLTLPVFIRNWYSHGMGESTKNVEPTKEEIDFSISLLIGILLKENKQPNETPVS